VTPTAKRLRLVAASAVASLIAVAGCAPVPTVPGDSGGGGAATFAAPVTDAELPAFTGIARIGLDSQCTATALDLGVDDAPAYLLTAGHCLTWTPGPNGAEAIDGQVATFQTLQGGVRTPATFPVVQREYASMHGTDLAIVRLDATVADLRAAGVRPLALASAPAAADAEVVNVGIPVEGVPEAEQVLRRGECTMGATVEVVEHIWSFGPLQRNDCPGIRGGSSGSPVLLQDEIVGVINTTTGGWPGRGGECWLGAPCEVADSAATAASAAVVRPETSYAVPITGLSACWNDAGTFQRGNGCPLAAPVTGETTNYGSEVRSAALEEGAATGVTVMAEPGQTVTVDLVAIGNIASCRDGSAPAVAVDRADGEIGADGVIDLAVRVPATEGRYVACIRVNNVPRSPQFFHVDDTAPQRRVQLSVSSFDATVVRYEPIFSPPELSGFRLKHGPEATTDCADEADYGLYRRIPIEVPASELPVAVCVIGEDHAGNATEPYRQVLTSTDLAGAAR